MGGGVWLAVGGVSLSGGTDSVTGLPSSVCPLTAPIGHDGDSCCVMTTPLGMVHLTWASAGRDAAANAALQASFKIFTDISYVPRRLKGRMAAPRKVSMLGSVLCGVCWFFKRSKQPYRCRPVFFGEAFQYCQGHRAWVTFTVHFCESRWCIHPANFKCQFRFNIARHWTAHVVRLSISVVPNIGIQDAGEGCCFIAGIPQQFAQVGHAAVLFHKKPQPDTAGFFNSFHLWNWTARGGKMKFPLGS